MLTHVGCHVPQWHSHVLDMAGLVGGTGIGLARKMLNVSLQGPHERLPPSYIISNGTQIPCMAEW